MKKIIVFLGLLSFLSFGCRAQPSPAAVPHNNASTDAVNSNTEVNSSTQTPKNYSGADYTTQGQPSVGSAYSNSKMGFSLRFPKNWYLPPTDDMDPHFYETKACLDNAELTVPCVAMEIQLNSPSLKPDPNNPYRKADGTKAPVSTKLVPGATVVITDPEPGAEGWSIAYLIFFNNKAFLVYSNDASIEKTILPSFKLVP